MKTVPLLFLLSIMLSVANAQLKVKPKCGPFTVNILDGKVNDVRPDFTNGQIKKKLPCNTSEEEEGASKCGGGVFYKDQDVKFYTGRDYVEIGPAFKGKLTIPLMGAKRGTFFKWLGNPKLKDDDWDAFQTQYGCLILYYNSAAKVKMIRFSTKSTDELNLCE
jgi:hypothetical protein